ncbi:hypothetical protein CC1G_12277 [Coprinopsis cinerea okayama7|uniref:F-box domain-containing protein n=1 Tax=Coprinopsis cinerea (strain Okayama-7 / 130 / ATCC MYA-4618 / FGSC 9003) TaxID=240176 RepID=A8MZR7_COPC7|nr:hypothetical protein CC1G_12277 [Coprinopsis cinerea okayama7\|eukprot:XP_001828129.2 hypothetical protein CC1G_12277 [Coprinopsis cinerea okayama7\
MAIVEEVLSPPPSSPQQQQQQRKKRAGKRSGSGTRSGGNGGGGASTPVGGQSGNSSSRLRKWFSISPGSKSGKTRVKRPSKRRSQAPVNEEEQLSSFSSTATRSYKSLFSRRPSTSSTTSTKKPFTPWLPPELWVLIFHHACSPSHPFLSSALIAPNEPLSFLEFPHSHSHLLNDYRRSMRSKATITYVCKLWHSIGQEVLYEFVWITRAREAALLAELLDRKAIRDVSADSTAAASSKGKGKGKNIVRHGHQLSDTTNFDYNNRGAYTYPWDTRGVGRHIRRLHIETNTLDRCAPQDLLMILDHAPLLQVYSDYQSIRRTTGFTIIAPASPSASASSSGNASSGLGLGSSRPSSRGSEGSSSSGSSSGSSLGSTIITSTSTFTSSSEASSHTTLPPPQQQESDQQVLSALLAHPARRTNLRRLSWTNYEYEPEDYEAGVRFYLRVVGPKLKAAKENLEFLELTLCAKDLRGMTGQGGTGGGFFESVLMGGGLGGPDVGGGITASSLTTLSASLTSTVTTTTISSSPSSSPSSFSSSSPLSRTLSRETLKSISAASPLVLPALRSLKVTLDNATFHVLSTWEMPSLRNLSVVSADFSYAGEGFKNFFEVHGAKIQQLELGHSTGAIEEFWLTANPNGGFNGANGNVNNANANGTNAGGGGNGNAGANGSANTGWTFGSTRVPLAEWCPNLSEFICSADAEWNWQNPDWIAPHVLLPAHPTLKFIGVRDMEKRILEALERVEYRDLVAVREGRGLVGLEDLDDDSDPSHSSPNANANAANAPHDDPFFMLQEQIGSLLRREAFPGLRYVRDLSPVSEVIRRTGRVSLSVLGGGGLGVGEDREEGEEGSVSGGGGGVLGSGSGSGSGGLGGGGAAAVPAPPQPSWGWWGWILGSQQTRQYIANATAAAAAGGGGTASATSAQAATATSASTSMAQHSSSSAHPSLTSSTHHPSSSQPSSSGPSSSSTPTPPPPADTRPSGRRLQLLQERQQGLRVLRFWMKVMRMFRERGVWLEDCDGMNVTVASLRRAAAASSSGSS